MALCQSLNCQIFMKFGIDVVYKKLLSKQVYHKNQPSNPHFIYGYKQISTCNIHIYRLSWVKFGTEDLHVMPFSKSEICGNWHREGHTLLVDVNGIIFIHVPSNYMIFWEYRWPWWSHHHVNRMQSCYLMSDNWTAALHLSIQTEGQL